MQETDKQISCALLLVGTELVSGQTLDTNSAYLSLLLEENGIAVTEHLKVSDDHKKIVAALKFLLQQCATVIVVGGLGPTQDDITKEAVAEVTQRSMQKNERLSASLATFSPFSKVNEKMVALPSPVDHLFISNVGTAPAFSIEFKGKEVICLPGVPMEMKILFAEDVLPHLLKNTTLKTQCVRKLFFPCTQESKVEEVLLSVINDEVSYGIYPSFGYVILLLKAPQELMFLEIENHLKAHFAAIRLSKNMGIPATVVKQLDGQGVTLAVAESCTGGLLAKEISGVPGASNVFKGGVVAYCNAAKEEVLGIDPNVLSLHGAVSEAVAKEMAECVKKKFHADIGVGITGIAGPAGGSTEKPVGTVFIAIAYEETTVYQVPAQRLESREAVQAMSANWALGELCKLISS